MREIKVGKVTLNIGVGGPGEELERAKNLLENLSGQEAKETRARGKNTFGVSEGRKIGAKVTLRGGKGEEFLQRALEATNKELEESSFDRQGNFSIGIEEHIDLPGTEYDPETGIFGLDVTVTLERPGFRLKRRKVSKPIGKNHRISKKEAIDFVKESFNVKVNGG